MRRLLIQRLIQGLIVLWAAATIVFVMTRLSGSPAVLFSAENATPAEVEAVARSLGLSDPLPVQYGRFLWNLLRGDLGASYSFRAPVSELILGALPFSAQLAISAYLIATILGVSLGTIAAMHSGSWVDSLAKFVALIGQSVPSFGLGLGLLLAFSVGLGLLPAYGSGSAAHLVLPAVTLAALPMAAMTRLTRSAVLDVLRSDLVAFERSKGVRLPVLIMHILRNASLPIVTLSGIQLGALLSGGVVVETFFAYPGIGQLVIQAINSRDYNLVQGVVIVATAIFVILSLLVDLSYAALDPRTRR